MSSEGWKRCPENQTHHCPHCPLHRHRHCPLHNPHNLFFPPPPQTLHYQQLPVAPHVQISQELEHIELDGEEEDDEPVFVLTDEWRDFFAKSEARRKLEKKQSKKGKK